MTYAHTFILGAVRHTGVPFRLQLAIHKQILPLQPFVAVLSQ